MTTVDTTPWPAAAWRRQLADAVTNVDELLRMLELDDCLSSATPSGALRFPIRVPRGFIARMRPGDPSDPLLRQVLPLAAEDNPLAGFTTDPVGELGRPTVDGVLYKYHGRALVVVLHANHANEIDGDVRRALAALAATGATLLNQSVLLGGVNDEVDAMADLSESLFAAGVLPYYLHMLDPVDGAAHFRVSDERARELVSALAARLPGYLVPRLVREVGGAPAKVGVDLWG